MDVKERDGEKEMDVGEELKSPWGVVPRSRGHSNGGIEGKSEEREERPCLPCD